MNEGFNFVAIVLIWGTALFILLPHLMGIPSADMALVGLADALSSIARNVSKLQ